MITPGQFNSLTVKEILPVGVLAVCDSGQTLMVPYAQSHRVGTMISVFAYYNQEGQLEGTTYTPRIQVDQFASLKVISIINAGAFLDWGLKPDLFLPTRLMHSSVAASMPVVVRLVHDSQRKQLVADSKIEGYLKPLSPYHNKHEAVDLLIYAESPLGYKAIINQSHQGLIYKNELPTQIRIGQTVTGFVKRIRDDGKVDLELQQHTKETRDELAEKILQDLYDHDGISSLTDKSSADLIYHRFKVSKGVYKRALGNLYKQKKIIIAKEFIKLSE